MSPDVVVAGHLCLDVIPHLRGSGVLLQPGSLVEAGPATIATGGAVANVGLALLRLGVPVTLVSKVGDDAWGALARSLLEQADPAAARGLRVSPGEHTSYSIVISRPGMDRAFLHHPGCNDSFGAADVDRELVASAKLFYFGYPPLMKRMYHDGGQELAALLAELRAAGLTTVLDMAMPDPRGASGRVDWMAFLRRVLPHVDLFLPSLDELLLMLKRPPLQFDDDHAPPVALCCEVAQQLLDMGVAVAGLKLGSCGLYLRSAGWDRLDRAGRGLEARPAWIARELWCPVFEAAVQGTTGAGDATVAGLLAGMLYLPDAKDALVMANAVGACSVEAADAVSGVRDWEATRERVARGWRHASQPPPGDAWRQDAASGVWRGPGDKGEAA